MNCAEALELIGPLCDGELDLRSCAELERHLAGCAGCAAERDAILALRASVRAKLPVHPLPPGMPARVSAALRRAAPKRPLRRAARLWPALLVPAAAAALLLAPRPTPAPGLADTAFEAHLRSLQASHLLDVVSTDRHTVKPWFEGKLDFAVPVADLAAQGLPLEGGRLDHLAGRPVAALVYRDGKHAVNLFLWPESRDRPLRIERARGLASASWASGGFERWLVSDVSEPQLLRAAGLLGAEVK